MKNNFLKLNQKEKKAWKSPKANTINRFWGKATRLEHPNVRGKNGKKYGGSEN